MAALTPLEAHDALRFAQSYQERIGAAEAELAARRGLKAEKEWLAAARALAAAASEGTDALLDRARSLPELAEVCEEVAAAFQNQWVDALERLLAGITFHVGGRDPVIEALFPHQKFAALRRASRENVADYAAELGRRLKSSYVSRILAQPEYAFAQPVLEQIAAAWSRWESAFSPPPISEEQQVELRKELIAAGRRADVAVRQARLLAEAALVPVPDAFEQLGLNARPKKRAARKPVEAAAAAPEQAAASQQPASASPDVPGAPAPGESGAAPAAPTADKAAPEGEGKRKRRKAAAE